MNLRTRSKAPLLAAAALMGACMVQPPASRVQAAEGIVRAADQLEALRISAMLDSLGPRLEALLPNSSLPDDLEVWIQGQPRLYAFPGSQVDDAEGLWSEHHHRVLLARNADNLERTLAHELAHAALDEPWQMLPGTLEEGLCDLVSARLCPQGASRLRAGRLCSAALACGGLKLELRLSWPDDQRQWLARVTLSGEDQGDSPQQEVFEVEAGLSSTALTSGTKRGFYGLAFLVMERATANIGLEGIRDLCQRAETEDLDEVPPAWLLEAAELEDETLAWRRAAVEQMGPEELRELVQMYPNFAVDALYSWLVNEDLEAGWPEGLVAELELLGGPTISLVGVDSLLESLRERQAENSLAQLTAAPQSVDK
ncbi:MAG: hypothetical protein ABGY32_03180 [bacterium]